MKSNNSFEKIIIVVLICVCGYLLLSKTKEKEETNYYIDSLPHEVCGKTIYITDFTYSNTLNIDRLLDEIEYVCKNK
jgi:hypothetical protein